MSERQIAVEGEEEFNPREWLRREVLWASLMAPYPVQMEGWLNGLEAAHHSGNTSRKKVYEEFSADPESQSKAYFNHGKVIGGLISSAVVFRANLKSTDLRNLYDSEGYPVEETLKLQARNIDIALGNIVVRGIIYPSNDRDAFIEAERMAQLASESQSTYALKKRYLRAGKIMTGLARQELEAWIGLSHSSEEKYMPELVIPNGGTPRSAGPRVEKLQTVFHEIIESEQYRALSSA